MTRRTDAARARADRAAGRLGLLTPSRQLVLLRQRLGALGQRLSAAARQRLAASRQRLASAAGTLHALSPLATLERGYALVRRADDGRVVRDCATAPAGTRVSALLADGELDCRVESCRPREP